MGKVVLMNSSKMTPNKLRWCVNVNGTSFNIYIPKRCVPKPWPAKILVSITKAEAGNQTPIPRRRGLAQPIVTDVVLDRRHGETARYKPEGYVNEWEISQSYVPYEILESVSSGSFPNRLRIEVKWSYSAGTWEDNRESRRV